MIMGIKTKKVINIAELIVIGLIVWGIIGTYKATNSIPSLSVENKFLSIGIDITLMALFLFRSFLISKNFNKSIEELNDLKLDEKISFVLCLLLLLPYLKHWCLWNYYVGLYLDVFVIFSLPIIFWTVELIQRSSRTGKRWNFYGGGIFGLLTLIILFRMYFINFFDF